MRQETQWIQAEGHERQTDSTPGHPSPCLGHYGQEGRVGEHAKTSSSCLDAVPEWQQLQTSIELPLGMLVQKP